MRDTMLPPAPIFAPAIGDLGRNGGMIADGDAGKSHI